MVFDPRLRVKITPRNTPFSAGTIALEVREFDPSKGFDFSDESGWQTADSRWLDGAWPADKSRRLTLWVPSALLPGEGVYQCRVHMEELDEVDEGEYATLTDSYYFVRQPFRLHGAATAVALIVGVAGLLGGLIGALLTAFVS